MDYTVIAQLVGSLGFPIVCCGYMMVTMNKTIKDNTEATTRMSALIDKVLDRLNITESKTKD